MHHDGGPRARLEHKLVRGLGAAVDGAMQPAVGSRDQAQQAEPGIDIVEVDQGIERVRMAEERWQRIGHHRLMNVQPGDIIDRLDDTPVRTVAEFATATATAALRVGANLRVTLRRAGQERVLSGTIAALPRPRDLATNAEPLTSEIAKVSAAVERERMRADLAETLRLLTAFQEGLPRVAEEFKKVYPKGTFKVRTDIDISSDPEAKEQTALMPAPAEDAPPATPASGGEGPGPKPAVP